MNIKIPKAYGEFPLKIEDSLDPGDEFDDFDNQVIAELIWRGQKDREKAADLEPVSYGIGDLVGYKAALIARESEDAPLWHPIVRGEERKGHRRSPDLLEDEELAFENNGLILQSVQLRYDAYGFYVIHLNTGVPAWYEMTNSYGRDIEPVGRIVMLVGGRLFEAELCRSMRFRRADKHYPEKEDKKEACAPTYAELKKFWDEGTR